MSASENLGAGGLVLRAVSVALHIVLRNMRLLFYNARAFSSYQLAPFDTIIYGRLKFAHLPCRVALGRRCCLGDGVYFSTGRNALIEIGDDVSINAGCLLVASERIVIGRSTAIGEYVSIRDQAHNFAPGHGVRGQGFRVTPVKIGRNVWVGRGVFIGPGTEIGDNSIIGANSVVHGIFPPNVLVAGAPARVRKTLNLKAPTTEALALVNRAVDQRE